MLNFDYGSKYQNQSNYIQRNNLAKVTATRPKTQEKKTRNTIINNQRPIDMLAKRFSGTKLESESNVVQTTFEDDIGVNTWRPKLQL